MPMTKLSLNMRSTICSNDIIEPSSSPWRTQVLIVNDGRHKKRLVIDYSRTVYRFTLLDAYPLSRIDDLIKSSSNWWFNQPRAQSLPVKYLVMKMILVTSLEFPWLMLIDERYCSIAGPLLQVSRFHMQQLVLKIKVSRSNG